MDSVKPLVHRGGLLGTSKQVHKKSLYSSELSNYMMATLINGCGWVGGRKDGTNNTNMIFFFLNNTNVVNKNDFLRDVT